MFNMPVFALNKGSSLYQEVDVATHMSGTCPRGVLTYLAERECAALMGRFFYKKSLNIGNVFYQRILKHGSTFLTEPKFSNVSVLVNILNLECLRCVLTCLTFVTHR